MFTTGAVSTEPARMQARRILRFKGLESSACSHIALRSPSCRHPHHKEIDGRCEASPPEASPPRLISWKRPDGWFVRYSAGFRCARWRRMRRTH